MMQVLEVLMLDLPKANEQMWKHAYADVYVLRLVHEFLINI